MTAHFSGNPLFALLVASLFVLGLPIPSLADGARIFTLPYRDDLAHSPNWTVVEGAWRYQGGFINGSGNDARVTRGDIAWTDCNITGRFRIESGTEAAILFRVQEANYGDNSGRYFQLSNNVAGTVTLYRISMGAMPQKSASATIAIGTWYDFRLAINGSVVDYYLNSTWLLNFTTLDFTAGMMGLKAPHSTCHFDDIRVSDRANATLLSDDFATDPIGKWAPMKGTWSFGGGYLDLVTDKTRNDYCVAPIAASGPSWTAQAQLMWTAGQYFESGLMFCFGDIGNNYHAYLSAFDGTLRIQRTAGGTSVDDWAQVSFPVKKNEWYTITITRNDTAFKFYINSALVLSKSDASVLPGTGFALGSWSAVEEKVRYNFFEVVEGEHPPMPDLTVNASNLELFPAHPNPGDSVKILFTVENIGTAAAAGNMAMDVTCNGTLLARKLENVLAAGASVDVEVYWTANLSGNLSVTLAADAQDQIRELNESNNNYTFFWEVNAKPVSSFTLEPAGPVRVMDELELNGTNSTDADGTIADFYWTFGDASAASTMVAHHHYSSPGTYKVTLKVTDNDGAFSESNRYVTVTKRSPVATVSCSPQKGNITTVFGFSFTLFDPDDSMSGYSWSFGDGSNSTDRAPTHRYADDGLYNVTLSIRYNSGKNVTEFTKELLVENLAPVATLLFAPEEMLKSTEENFTACATDADDPQSALTFLWTFGDGTNASGKEARHSYPRSGMYRVNLTVWDDDGANSTVSALVHVVNVMPISQFAPPPPGYANSSYHFDATTARDPDGSIVNYSWDFGDGSKGYGMAIDHNYTMPGNYTVRLSVTDNEGATCSTSSLLVVREVPRPPPPPPPPPEDGVSALLYVAAGIGIAVALVAVALVARSRKRGGGEPEGDVNPLEEDSIMQGPGNFQG